MAQLSDRIRTIAARLCLHDDTKLDGQMLHEIAGDMASLESELAEIDEHAGEFVLALNDPLNAMQALAEKLKARRNRLMTAAQMQSVCQQCGVPVDDDDTYCPQCSAKLV